MKKSFNFLKSLDIAAIINDNEFLHPSTHDFWEEEGTRAAFLEFLAAWSKNPAAYFKKTFAAQDDKQSIQQSIEEEEIEVVFVDGLFEMYKLRCDIAKARVEHLADSAVSSYNHKFGTFIFRNHIDYRSSWIESLANEETGVLEQGEI